MERKEDQENSDLPFSSPRRKLLEAKEKAAYFEKEVNFKTTNIIPVKVLNQG